jgi:hypothetical protein
MAQKLNECTHYDLLQDRPSVPKLSGWHASVTKPD